MYRKNGTADGSYVVCGFISLEKKVRPSEVHDNFSATAP